MEQRELPTGLETNPQRPNVVVATATLYKNWYLGQVNSIRDTDKVRGDVAIDSLGRTIRNGFSVVDIDGGSSPAFLEALNDVGVEVTTQKERGYSEGRREGMTLAQEDSPKAIFTVEPEKPSLMDSIDKLTKPIVEGDADIVFPARDRSAFDTYPKAQADFEQRANKIANKILREREILKDDTPDLDWWMGARMIRNDPEVLALFQEKYDFREFGNKLDETINLEAWPNTLYLPVIFALARGMKVASVPIDYVHPESLTLNETGDPAFDRKRETQYKGIIVAMIEGVRRVEQDNGVGKKQTRLIS